MKRPRLLNPHLYEINALLFMERMRCTYGADCTLGKVPRSEWEKIASKGFSYLWLMGIWERSPGSKQCALKDAGLTKAYCDALPGWSEKDVKGSPYAVHSYVIDPSIGTGEELRNLRSLLKELGMGLILDFVPNHVAIDHPWTSEAPERFIQGTEEDARREPGLFSHTDSGRVIAHGRDPFFPAWTDTAQINIFSPKARRALIDELKNIAQYADGVRCDMAMLVLNNIFEKTWAKYLGDYIRLDKEFWADAIKEIKAENPSFLFLAEAYWDLEYRLQQLGFDYTYDKKLYDLMLHSSPRDVRNYLFGDETFQRKCIRFMENHDEQRAASSFGKERSLAGAVITATVPGLHLFHEGQFEGYAVRVPVQLSSKKEEQTDTETKDFYDRLFSFTSTHRFGSGFWRPLEVRTAWNDNWTFGNLLAWVWYSDHTMKLVCVNYAPETSQGRINIPHALIQAGPLTFRDVLTDEIYVRTTDEITGRGLFVELGPWKAHLFDLLE